LRFNAGPGGEILLPVNVRWDLPLGQVCEDRWRAEHKANVVEEPFPASTHTCQRGHRLEVFDPPGVEQVADRAEHGVAGLDFGFEETEADYEFLY
ncbi:MAG: hypothetical protein ACYSVY_27315, partial [Planctomycetota bacterium]